MPLRIGGRNNRKREKLLGHDVHESDPSDSMESTLQGSITPAPRKLHFVGASNYAVLFTWKRGNSFQPVVHGDRFARLVEEGLEGGLYLKTAQAANDEEFCEKQEATAASSRVASDRLAAKSR